MLQANLNIHDQDATLLTVNVEQSFFKNLYWRASPTIGLQPPSNDDQDNLKTNSPSGSI
jgi:hypothetical protein